MKTERLGIVVQGQVQGVGFRPHAYRIASQLKLTGYVQNAPQGAYLEIQGHLASVFMTHLTAELPSLATIRQVHITILPLKHGEENFEIKASESGKNRSIISPDACICSDCLQDLFNSESRYFKYPFLNCSHCGPRLTITQALPYDRNQTSMADFPLCTACETDYHDPANRRYHAQPTACQQCGPQLSLAIDIIAQRILEGEIIALKGLGGYQLLCDANNIAAIEKLRTRKNRDAKPFALLVPEVESAYSLVELNKEAVALLQSRARPIVLLRKIHKELLPAIAPGLAHLGIMLPSTPLHYLLLEALSNHTKPLLIVTSANLRGEPLVVDDSLASTELSKIASTVVSYNRRIVSRIDDSVMQLIDNSPVFIRRARGFVPNPIKLAHSIPPTLAVGAHLKNTFCITREDEAYVSQHIGSLTNKATIDFFHETLDHFLRLLDVIPERIAHDSHPDFYTTQFAENVGIPAFAIQHHHAHLASVAAEHRLPEPLLGLTLDGYGYGVAGEAWGAELLLLNNTSFQRLGSLTPLPQPGGELAAREPWRMAAAVLHGLGKREQVCHQFAAMPAVDGILSLLDGKINTPLSSSCGRLFDAASALLGVQCYSHYEGQAAMILESLVTCPKRLEGGWNIVNNSLDMMPTLAVLADLHDPVQGANLFHGTLIAGLNEWILGIAREMDIDTVVLSGGCFINKILAEGLLTALRAAGIQPYLPRQLPPNDGGISLGQAWIAGRL